MVPLGWFSLASEADRLDSSTHMASTSSGM